MSVWPQGGQAAAAAAAAAAGAHSLCCAASADARTTSLGRGAAAAASRRGWRRTLLTAAGRRTALCIAAAIDARKMLCRDQERAGPCGWLGKENAWQDGGRVAFTAMYASETIARMRGMSWAGRWSGDMQGWRRRRLGPAGAFRR